MVKLQKRFAYKYKDKEHYKHVIIVSDDIIKKLGWKEGDELEQTSRANSLILKRKKDT